MSSRFTPSARIGKEDMVGRKYHLIVSVHFCVLALYIQLILLGILMHSNYACS